uniref:Uncharacterized protein n=1 Tax=Lepeophtheirus salmonis TaxID=72036 RepID=A0A0K2UB52_LEPSM
MFEIWMEMTTIIAAFQTLILARFEIANAFLHMEAWDKFFLFSLVPAIVWLRNDTSQ